jgi:hypothetical protein
MRVSRLLRLAAIELAFASALFALLAGSVTLMQRTAPQQLQALCLSTKALVHGLPFPWACAAPELPQGQPIASP